MSKMNIIFTLFLIVRTILSQELGEECQIPVARSTKFIPGKCLILQDCTEALAGLSKGILPRICGYRGLEAVVCCPERITKNPMNKTQHISYPNRISKRKCAEYGKSVFKLVESPLLGMLGPEYINISTCESSVEPLIVGGIYARPKQFPHMALLGLETNNNEKKWMCSGSLISEKFVITAAHCTSVINRGEIKWVRLGDLDFASTRDDSQFADYSIVQIFRHPKYRRPVLYNDIALVEVDRPVEFNEYIRPACLYSGNDDQLDKLIISGWTFSPDIDGHLRQYSALKSVSHEKCTNIFRFIQRRLRNGISEETMICSEQAHNDACFISSGAALQIYNKDVYCMYDLVGISSYSRGFCISTPSIHTRISGYINWIESIVWPEVIQM